jgi:NitT/TauT family transport system permease protein
MDHDTDRARADATARAIATATAVAPANTAAAEPPTRLPTPIGDGAAGAEPPTLRPAPLPLASKVAEAPCKPDAASAPPPDEPAVAVIAPLLGVVFVIALIAAGVAYLAYGTADGRSAPTPGAIFAAATKLRAEQVSWAAALHTLASTTIGVVGALALGLGLGVLIGRHRAATAFFEPLVIVVRAVPAVALLPLAVLWFGAAPPVGWAVAFAAAIVVLGMMGARIAGDRRRHGGMSWRWIWLAAEIGVLLAFAGALAAEMVAGRSGLGGLLAAAIGANDLPRAFAVVGLIGLWGFVLPLPFAILRWRSRT